jgi:thymidylate synthase (FAD)
MWDFSRANESDEARIEAITTIASICYNNPNIIGKESLYNRLKAESKGLPSSSFEFVPVLISTMDFLEMTEVVYEHVNNDPTKPLTIMNIERYGEFIIDGGISYLLTNYRALLYDYENHKEVFDKYDMDITKYYNSILDSDIIKRHYHVFNIKMDMATSKQFVRHRRQNLQELSRRYVSGDKAPFEFYVSEKIKKSKAYGKVLTHIADSVELYNELRDSGI